MAVTPNLSLAILSASQQSKHVSVNEALRVVDAVQSLPTIIIIDNDLTAPPGSPTDGATYIPAATATGAWVGQEGKIAYYNSNAWVFHTPAEGWIVYVADENIYLQYDGSVWVGFPQTQQNLALLGINTTADATNKLAVRSNAVLFTALYVADSGNGDIQYKVNKESTSDTGSFLFQTNFAGRAEFGLIGTDDFTLKVSPDDFATSYDALVVDKDTGDIDFKQNMTAHGGNLDVAFEAAIAESDVASAASKNLIVAATGDQWKITEIMLAPNAVNFSGGGGDRNLAIEDASGTVQYTVIPAAVLQSVVAGRWGDTEVPFPATAADFLAATTAGENLVARYSGGTTDYTTGSISVVIKAKKVT